MESSQPLVPIKMPLAVLLQQACDMHKICYSDLEAVKKVGLDMSLVDAIPQLVLDLSKAHSDWINVKKDSVQEGKELKKYIAEMCKFRTDLSRSLRFAAKKAGVKLVVPYYKTRSGYEVSQHLNDLAVMGRRKRWMLEKINFDMSILEEAVHHSFNLTEKIIFRRQSRPVDSKERKARDELYSKLYRIVEEIRICGKFAMRHSRRRKLYANSYWRRPKRGRPRGFASPKPKKRGNVQTAALKGVKPMYQPSVVTKSTNPGPPPDS
ncbi:hypothetical protein QA601_09645 [Chitinispirillales bacterium ANBcel5]|uniref:hypothetical protein n=1 Tax=Cellulosispirillum alkaliphilum TaxID=3039283 RepID=UPI002A516C86|nr:hypothetical protein [Chitinispirillales bacterium ANBcel5]